MLSIEQQRERVRKVSKAFRILVILALTGAFIGSLVGFGTLFTSPSLDVRIENNSVQYSTTFPLSQQTDTMTLVIFNPRISDRNPDEQTGRGRTSIGTGGNRGLLTIEHISDGLAYNTIMSAPLTFKIRLQLAVVTAIYLLLGFYFLVLLTRLFRQFESGQIFSAEVVRVINRLGITLIAFALCSLVIGYLSNLLIRSAFPEESYYYFNLPVTPLLAGILLCMVSWVMDVGRQIHEENELTV